MTFGERLIELRKERGFNNRSEFADYIGMPSTTLRNYETNVREPGHVFLKQMADIFHVSIDYLLCMTDDRTPYKEKASFSKKELDHIEKYRSLDATGQKHVDSVLQWEVDLKYLMDQKNEQIKGMTEYTDKMQEIFYDDEETIFADSIKPYDITIEVNHKNTIDKNKEKIRRLAMYLSKLQKLAHDNGATPDQAAAADAIMKDDDEWK